MAAFDSSPDSDYLDELEDNLMMLLFCQLVKANRNKRKCWVSKVNRRRQASGEYNRLIKNLKNDDTKFQTYFRMTKVQYDKLHELIQKDIRKKSTKWREPISTEERLAVCLRFLATGDSFRTIAISYHLGFSTVRCIIEDVCEAIWIKLSPIVMPKPTKEKWIEVAAEFNTLWNFPNCVGALGGKNINIRSPIKAGPNFYNYRGQNSIVFLALVDAQCKFLAVDIGAYGRNRDGGILKISTLGKSLEQNQLKLPQDFPLTPGTEPLPYVIAGNRTFPLKPYLLRPYRKGKLAGNKPNKIFNHRLSQARTVVENAFDILASRWRVFQRRIHLKPNMVDKVVLAACCLHNYLGQNYDVAVDIDDKPIVTEEDRGLTNIDLLRRNYTDRSFGIREKFKEFFTTSAGSIPDKNEMVS